MLKVFAAKQVGVIYGPGFPESIASLPFPIVDDMYPIRDVAKMISNCALTKLFRETPVEKIESVLKMLRGNGVPEYQLICSRIAADEITVVNRFVGWTEDQSQCLIDQIAKHGIKVKNMLWSFAIACGSRRVAEALQVPPFRLCWGTYLRDMGEMTRVPWVAKLMRELRARDPEWDDKLLHGDIFTTWDIDDILMLFEATDPINIKSLVSTVSYYTGEGEVNDKKLVDTIRGIQGRRVERGLEAYNESDIVLAVFIMSEFEYDDFDIYGQVIKHQYATALVKAGFKPYTSREIIERWSESQFNFEDKNITQNSVVYILYEKWLETL